MDAFSVIREFGDNLCKQAERRRQAGDYDAYHVLHEQAVAAARIEGRLRRANARQSKD